MHIPPEPLLILLLIIVVIVIALCISANSLRNVRTVRKVRGGNDNEVRVEQDEEEQIRFLNTIFYDKRYESKIKEGKTKEQAKQYAQEAVNDALNKIKSQPGYYIFIAKSDAPIGGFYVYINNDRGMAFIHYFGIYKEHRGRGYAKQALEALKNMIKEKFYNVKTLKLSVEVDNIVAKKAYDRSGFKIDAYSMSTLL